jgi:NAD(P)-dependent dehydrogenase (short-subunit alcohol dehydrogenase family)
MTDTLITRRTALVTGASYGIGAAIAEVLARDGFNVAVTELKTDALADTLGKIAAQGARGHAVALDTRSQDSIEACLHEVVQTFGKLDLLVNNAGVLSRKSVVDITRAEWQAVMDVNLTGTFFMSQAMGRHLISGKRKGAIISIASTHGFLGIANTSAYGISKAGISHMTRMLAIEWAEHGIRVNAIAPGTTETPSRKASFDADPKRRQTLIERIPFKRFCTEADVAGAASYLASPAADYVTGQTLLVDGGLTSY